MWVPWGTIPSNLPSNGGIQVGQQVFDTLKKRKTTMTHILLALFLTLWSLVGAQPGGRGNDRLERAGLKVGQAIPQANLYTADGRHFSLSELGGSYTVLIFGCLT